MKQKINFRLAFIAVVAILSATIGITYVCYGLFRKQVRGDLKTSARLLMETNVFQDAHKNAEEGMTEIVPAEFSSGQLRITWVSEDGTVLYDNDTTAALLPNHLTRPEIIDALKNGEGESVRRSDTFNMDTYYYALLLKDGTVLRVGMQASAIIGIFLTILPIIVLIAVVILFLCIVLGHALTGQLLRSIEEMAENLEDGNAKMVYKELEPFADTIRKQHENILAAAKSRQDFTANVSHELKTPLTAISGYAELIENHMIGPEEESHIAEQIRKNAGRLLSLINDIIKLSELDHKELPRRFEQVDLFAIAKECCDNLQTTAERKNLKLQCEGQSVEINADRDMIREMLDNLVQNALQYNKEKGSVLVKVALEGKRPLLCVKDTGIGIPKDQQNRIFERFYRVDKSRSRETGGTGLGLAIVKHIAEIHNAELVVQSEPGMGTQVEVWF